MAVEDYLPIGDVKQSVEKKAKEKPKLQDLVTVEKPGKPVPASSMLDSSKTKKKKRAIKKPTKAPSKIKGNKTVILTEKPQAAAKIAAALGTPRRISDKNVSYFEVTHEGKKITVASAVGHLFNVEYVKGQTGWPIFDTEWRPSHEKKGAAFTKRYYNVLKKLAKETGEVIIATDYDIEGEVIGWNVLRFIFGRETAKRMKYSTLTKDELIKSYNNPMAELDWGHAYAGETRHILDWMYGINLSRALMSAIKTTGSFKLLSIGRVQGPALKIIADREREIQNFKPVPYWQAVAKAQGIELKHPNDIFDKKELEKFKNIKGGDAVTKETEEKIRPPVPFDLTTLQREAYRWHKIGPSQVLKIAQKLYLDGLISYPRTSSQKIPDAINPKAILKSLERNFPHAKNAKRKKPIEGKKSDPAHPSIYPTGEFAQLKDNEKRLYELIVKRFISVFSNDAITENKRITVSADVDPSIKFKASGLKVKEKGWTAVYPTSMEESDMPTLNGPVKFDELFFPEKETQPPKRFSPTSLITMLEKKNLGTKATRSAIVDILFNRGYLDGKSIQATPLGMQLIGSLEKHSPIIIDENLTRQFEEEMETFDTLKEGHKEKEEEIIKHARDMITKISEEFKKKEKEIGRGIMGGVEKTREAQREQNTLNECPTCKAGNLQIRYSPKIKRNFIGCTNYPKCTQVYNLPPGSVIKKTDKECQDCGFPKLMSLKKGKKPWEFCFNTACPDNQKRLAEWKARKEKYASKSQPNE